MVASPTVTGAFDGDIAALNPEISICESSVANADCGGAVAALAQFSSTSTPAITVDAVIEHFQVNWNTREGAFNAGQTYRVHLRAGVAGARRQLGFADILLTDTPGQAKNITSGDVIVLQDGRTLPIKFRIETGIVGSIAVSVDPTTVRAGAEAIATAAVRDLHGALLAGSEVTWSASGVPIAIATASTQTGSDGNASTTVTAGANAGTATLTASSLGLDASAALTVVPAVIDRSDVLASMSDPRNGTAVASHGGLLYAMGGWKNFVGVRTTNEAYDPTTNQWSFRAPLPTPRMAGAAAVVNGIIYVIGGTPGGSCCATVRTVEAYDPATDSWTTKAPMLTAREQFGVAVHNGIIYAIGGWTPSAPFLSSVEAYDPTTNTWTPRAPMPSARSGHAVVQINGRIYVVGGELGATFQAPVFEYDPSTDAWTARAPIPLPRTRLGAAAVDGILYTVGGWLRGNNGGVTTIEAYDPAANSWTVKSGLNIPRWALGVAALNGVVYAVGGTKEILDVPELEAYRP